MAGTDFYSQSICCWPEDDRPREKLLKYGEDKLSNSELIAILLRTGVKGESAIDLARKIMHRFGTFRNMSQTDASDWHGLKGLGSAKISQIKAALEIGRRFREDEVREDLTQVRSSRDVVDILMPRLRDLKKEVFKVVLLNGQNKIIDIIEEDEGTVNQASPVIREIFQKALQRFAVSIICVHNHPSGVVDPSVEDKTFTRKLFDAGKIMQINVLDHLIIGDNKYYSFADSGNL